MSVAHVAHQLVVGVVVLRAAADGLALTKVMIVPEKPSHEDGVPLRDQWLVDSRIDSRPFDGPAW